MHQELLLAEFTELFAARVVFFPFFSGFTK